MLPWTLRKNKRIASDGVRFAYASGAIIGFAVISTVFPEAVQRASGIRSVRSFGWMAPSRWNHGGLLPWMKTGKTRAAERWASAAMWGDHGESATQPAEKRQVETEPAGKTTMQPPLFK